MRDIDDLEDLDEIERIDDVKDTGEVDGYTSDDDNPIKTIDEVIATGNDIDSWVRSSDTILDKKIQVFLNNTANKAKIVNSYLVLSNMSRVNRLREFIDGVEAELFNPEAIGQMTPKQLTYLYRMAIQRTQEIVNMNNQYIESKEGVDEETQRLLTVIKTLSPDQIKSLIGKIKEIKDDE